MLPRVADLFELEHNTVLYSYGIRRITARYEHACNVDSIVAHNAIVYLNHTREYS